MLLSRRKLPVAQAIESLVGLQAQNPIDPYVGLWARLASFRPETLSRLIEGRQAVRIGLMRATIHLVTARDALTIRPVVQSVLERTLYGQGVRARVLGEVDIEELLAAARELVDEHPRSRAQLRPLLAKRWPNLDPNVMSDAVGFLLPMVQVPPRGLWGQRGQPTLTTVESWLGRPLDAKPSVDQIILRYLAVFGPATVADARTWSGLSGLREVFERLRPRLRTLRDEDGRELFDVPRGVLPDPDTPAPPRFLPVYDNVVLSHADRSRIVADDHRDRLLAIGEATLLVDGFVRGKWKITRDRQAATLLIKPFGTVPGKDRAQVAEEGARLLAFTAGDADAHRVVWAS
jgi:winged helix DNA-binding protein